jgi:hypothetical protein
VELFKRENPATNIILNVGCEKHSEAFEGAAAKRNKQAGPIMGPAFSRLEDRLLR